MDLLRFLLGLLWFFVIAEKKHEKTIHKGNNGTLMTSSSCIPVSCLEYVSIFS